MNRSRVPIRGQVERTLGTLKRNYRWRRVRYRGLLRNGAHLHLLCTAMNLRRAEWLTGLTREVHPPIEWAVSGEHLRRLLRAPTTCTQPGITFSQNPPLGWHRRHHRHLQANRIRQPFLRRRLRPCLIGKCSCRHLPDGRADVFKREGLAEEHDRFIHKCLPDHITVRVT